MHEALKTMCQTTWYRPPVPLLHFIFMDDSPLRIQYAHPVLNSYSA